MRHLLGICFCFCFIVPFLATWSYLRIEKQRIRKEVKWQIIAGVQKDALVFFGFTRSETQTDLRWEHSREFEYRGEMYDIVDICENIDSVFYWCWWDHKETALNKSLNALTNKACGHSPSTHDSQQRLKDFLRSLYCAEAEPLQWIAIDGDQNPSSYQPRHTSLYPHAPPVPPPEHV